MLRTFRYPLYPTPAQEAVLSTWLRACCALYNGALQERRAAWRLQRQRISYNDQTKSLTEIRAADPAWSAIAPDPAEGEAPLPLDVLTPARLRAEAAGALRELFDLPAEAVGELMRRHVHLDLEARTVHVDVDRIAYAVLGDLRLTLD